MLSQKIPYAIERYTNEVKRLHRVLEKRLARGRVSGGRGILDGRHHQFPLDPQSGAPEHRPLRLSQREALARLVAARPAVQRGVEVLAESQRKGQMTDDEREIMFGKTQFAVR